MTRIVADPARQLGDLDRNVFGGFVEHLGRCIYGGLYDEGSPLADAQGFRTDVLGLLRELRMGVLRWPGGNFVSNYHWTDGIGPGRQPAPPSRAGLGQRGVEPVRHRRVHGLLRRAGHRALHLPEHGHRHAGGGAGLGRVLQRRGPDGLGRPAPGERP